MKPLSRILVALALASAAGLALAGNISLSLSGEVRPGVYGRVDVGPTRPVLVYEQPIVVTRPVRVVSAPPPPLYLAVPPGHAKHWSKHCGRYNACSRPVYFVRSSEYGRARGERDDGPAQGKFKDKDKGKGKDKGQKKDKDKSKGHDRGHGSH